MIITCRHGLEASSCSECVAELAEASKQAMAQIESDLRRRFEEEIAALRRAAERPR